MAVYEPNLIGVPPLVHERVAIQGLTGAASAFRAEASTATSNGDNTSAAAFNLWTAAIERAAQYPGRANANATLMAISKH